MDTKNQRVVLVTGASSGIGKTCATHLAARGFRVYGTSRQPGAVAGVTMLTLDVTMEASAQKAVAAILQKEGRLDVLVNNAGMGIAGPLEATTVEDAQKQFDVNFFGVVRLCRAALPAMRAQHYGYIINIGSIGGLLALPYQSMYSASKFALEGMSEALRMEVRSFGVRVVLIEPGDHRTGFTGSRLAAELTPETEAYRQSFRTALNKAASDEQSGPWPEQIALLVDSIVHQPNPRLRYTTVPLPQRAAIWLKRLGPHRLTEWVMRRYYGL